MSCWYTILSTGYCMHSTIHKHAAEIPIDNKNFAFHFQELDSKSQAK